MNYDNSKSVLLDIRKTNGDLIFSNFSAEDSRIFELTFQSNSTNGSRAKIIEKKGYKAKFLTKDADLINSNRIFNKTVRVIEATIEFYVSNLSKIESEYRLQINRLDHNLATYNALTLQEIDVLIPQAQVAGKQWKEKLAFIEGRLKRDIKDTAEAFLRIAKYNQGIKSELTAFDMIYKGASVLKVERHDVYTVIMNSLYNFFPDFNDIGVEIRMQYNSVERSFNYDSISVVLYHLLNNAAKYCLPNKPINISIRSHGSEVKIDFSMMSLRIEDSEIKEIFKDGVSGINAVKAKMGGRGVGMYVSKKLLKLNGGDIEVQITRSTNESHKGNLYEQNRFILVVKQAQ